MEILIKQSKQAKRYKNIQQDITKARAAVFYKKWQIEKNKFEELPEQVFIKGYIRSFAKVIGANEDEVLSTYIDITKTASSTDIKSQSIPKQNNYNFDPKFIFILIFIILFLSGAIWGVNTLIRKFNTESKESSPSVSQQKKKILVLKLTFMLLKMIK